MVEPGGQEGRLDLLLRMAVEQLGAFEFATPAAGGVLDVRVLEQVADGDGDRDEGETVKSSALKSAA